MTAYNLGFNFRSTLGYVTDGTNQVGVFGEQYPTNKTVNGRTVTVGWDGTVSMGDRQNTGDVRLAGGNYVLPNGTARKFRVDLPVSGVWTIRLAVGNAIFNRAAYFDILDSDGTTILYSKTNGTVLAANWVDATRTNRGSAAIWAASNQSIDLTFSGTAAYFRLNPDPGVGSELSHISFVKNTSPQATITDTEVDVSAGVAVLTVSLDVPAPVGGCSVDYSTANGTAIGGTHYSAMSGTLVFAAGEQTKNITVPIIPY